MPSRKQSGSEVRSSAPTATRGELRRTEAAPEPPAKARRSRQPRRAARGPRKRRQKAARPGHRRVRIDHAMRAIGLDESRLAGNFNRLLNRVDKPKKEKLHLEALKECGKLLDAYPAASHTAGNDPVPVQLVHSVPRPARPETSSEAKEAG